MKDIITEVLKTIIVFALKIALSLATLFVLGVGVYILFKPGTSFAEASQGLWDILSKIKFSR